MSTEDVSRMFLPQRKGVQRSSSSSSLASTASSSSTVTTVEHPQTNGESAAPAKKKARGGFWPVSKAESTAGVSSARANGSVQMSGKNPVQPALPAQTTQQNGTRLVNGAPPGNAAVLALLPMNGTFERKQINVPFFPDLLRVGRQTNAKTVPTPTNGYFDSKVLSRQHAEVWAEQQTGKVWIRDVKSSNGTFVNGQRLSPENRESEPHELRQHDTLELGIDIVSEDQKTIVHHKVSAKVEYVGLPGTSNNVLDLSFGDLDPSHGGPLLSGPMSAPMMHSRSRPGGPVTNGRSSAPSSIAGSQHSSGAQSRQLNFWGQTTPLSIEQLVKSITTELRAARQQAAEIEQVGAYIDGFTSPEGNIGKEKPESPIKEGKKLKSIRTDHIARFADPPAPPPQQPLPEKPDSAKSSPVNGISLTNLLKRNDTTKPSTSTGSSPTNTQNSQMLQLIEALSVAKKELDSQAARVKQLEDLLTDERTARVDAEERARRLEHTNISKTVSAVEEVTEQPVDKILEIETPDNTAKETSTDHESQLQQKLDATLAEMSRMKADMDKFKRRAETAETDATKARESLAEMIDRLRQENLKEEAHTALTREDRADSEDSKSTIDAPIHANGHIKTPRMPNLEQAVATVMRRDDNGELVASAPYVSMLGVVLIGVGLMAYLNSWQKTEK
jgi:hypothetical protein